MQILQSIALLDTIINLLLNLIHYSARILSYYLEPPFIVTHSLYGFTFCTATQFYNSHELILQEHPLTHFTSIIRVSFTSRYRRIRIRLFTMRFLGSLQRSLAF